MRILKKYSFLLIAITFLLILAGCSSKSKVAHTKNTPAKKSFNANKVAVKPSKTLDYSGSAKSVIDKMIRFGKSNLGVKYRSGGTNKDGFDCSGFVFATFKSVSITVPRSSGEMAKLGKIIDSDDIEKGDLVFFKTDNSSVINHVGLVVEVDGDEVQFIHSATSKGIMISSSSEPYYQKTYVQANRVF